MKHKKSKFSLIFRIISLVLIQAFLLMDIAWAAGGMLNVKDVTGVETLGPKLQLDVSAVQTVFSELRNESNPIAQITAAAKNNPNKSKDNKRSLSQISKNLVASAVLFVILIMPFASPALSAASEKQAQAPPSISLVQKQALEKFVEISRTAEHEQVDDQGNLTTIRADIRKNESVFTNSKARERVTQINELVNRLYARALVTGQLHEYMTNRGDSEAAIAIGKALLLIQIFDNEAFQELYINNVPIYLANIPTGGYTDVLGRFRGFGGRAVLSINEKFTDNTFWLADMIVHESVHVKKLPSNLFEFALKHNFFTLIRDFFSSTVIEESDAFAREASFTKNFKIIPIDKDKNAFFDDFDIGGNYARYKWLNVLTDLVGFSLCNVIPLIFGWFVIKFSRSKNRARQSKGAYRNSIGSALSNRSSRNDSRVVKKNRKKRKGGFLSLILVPILAMSISQGLPPANAAEFISAASSISSLQSGIYYSAKKISGTAISYIDVEKANDILGYAAEMIPFDAHADFVSFGSMGKSVAMTPELMNSWMEMKYRKGSDVHEIASYINSGSALFAGSVNGMFGRSFILTDDSKADIKITDMRAQWNDLLSNFYPETYKQNPLADNDYTEYSASTDSALLLDAEHNIKNNFLLSIDIADLTSKGFFQRSREEIMDRIKQIEKQLTILHKKGKSPGGIVFLTKTRGFLPMETDWTISQLENMLENIFGRNPAVAKKQSKLNKTVSFKRTLSLPAIFGFVGIVFSNLLSSGTASAAGTALIKTGVTAALSINVGTALLVSILGVIAIVLLISWIDKPEVKTVKLEKSKEEIDIINKFDTQELDTVLFIDVDLMRLTNDIGGNENVDFVFELLQNAVDKVKAMSGQEQSVYLRRGGDEFILGFKSTGDRQKAMEIALLIKSEVENQIFAIGCLGRQGISAQAEKIIREAGGKIAKIGKQTVFSIPQEAGGKKGKEKLKEFLLEKANPELSAENLRLGLPREVLTLDESKDIGVNNISDDEQENNQISFTLSIGSAQAEEALADNAEGENLYTQTSNYAAQRKDESKEEFKDKGNGSVKDKKRFEKRGETGESSLDQDAAGNRTGDGITAGEEVDDFKPIQQQANDQEAQGDYSGVEISKDSKRQSVKYYSNQGPAREFLNSLTDKSGIIGIALHGLGYFDNAGRISDFLVRHLLEASQGRAVKDNRIVIGDFKVGNEVFGYLAGDELIARLRMISARLSRVFDNFDVIIIRGPPAGPLMFLVPKNDTARNRDEFEINSMLMEFRDAVKQEMNKGSLIKMKQLRVFWDKFDGSNESVGAVAARIDKARKVSEQDESAAQKSDGIVRYHQFIEDAYDRLQEQQSLRAALEYKALKKYFKSNEPNNLDTQTVAEIVDFGSAVSVKNNLTEKLSNDQAVLHSI